jgi:hypothetical protein
VVGLGRLELPTPRLSSVCSNQLSYRPAGQLRLSFNRFTLIEIKYSLATCLLL